MDGGVTELVERAGVGGGAVAFVMRKAIIRILRIQVKHQFVAGGFGEDGCTGDAQRTLIAFDERGLGKVQFGEFEPEVS